jgi:CheY-like chemotaxis protein
MAMPGMTGLEFARAIWRDPKIPPPRVALVSALGSRPADSELRQAGVFGWVSKPLGARRLTALVRDMISTTPEAVPATDDISAVDRHSILESAKILVAEDNEVNRRVLAGMLKRLGCEAAFAVDGREVLQFLDREDFDVIFMDCQMPEMDGYECTRAIRHRRGPMAAVPIVALTANVLPHDRAACLAVGMDDFLTKPVKLDMLKATIERWIAWCDPANATEEAR